MKAHYLYDDEPDFNPEGRFVTWTIEQQSKATKAIVKDISKEAISIVSKSPFFGEKGAK